MTENSKWKAKLQDWKSAIWPVPLCTAVVSLGVGAGAMFLLTPRKDYEEELSKRALERVMKDVREAKSHSADLETSFQEILAGYHAQRKQRDTLALNPGLASFERLPKLEELDKALLKAEAEIYKHPLAKVANQRTLFLDFVLNKPAERGAK